MKAIVYTKYGGPEVLQIKEIEKPYPKDDEVLIKVHAASTNDWDFGLLRGDFINRILNGLLNPKKKILGSDIAGRIEAVGKNVTRFKTGGPDKINEFPEAFGLFSKGEHKEKVIITM